MTGNKVTVGIQIIPKSKDIDTYKLVDVAIAHIQSSGLKHLITPFETVLEGEYNTIMRVCKEAEKAVLEAGANECLVYYRIHYRKNEDVTFEEKKLDR